MPIPTPIGVGPRYHPAAPHVRCVQSVPAQRVHLELFAHGRVILIPSGIGCWTRDPTGVVHCRRGSTLGAFFRAWRQRLRPTQLLTFAGPVRIYRDGRRVDADPRRLALHDGEEIVLEVGPYVPPHRSYLFPPPH